MGRPLKREASWAGPHSVPFSHSAANLPNLMLGIIVYRLYMLVKGDVITSWGSHSDICFSLMITKVDHKERPEREYSRLWYIAKLIQIFITTHSPPKTTRNNLSTESGVALRTTRCSQRPQTKTEWFYNVKLRNLPCYLKLCFLDMLIISKSPQTSALLEK